jgi:hypothetical protein
MSEPKIILGEEPAASRRSLPPAPDLGWYLLGAVGIAFTLVGLVDLALVWYPADFGNAEFEFGSVTSVLNNMPIVALGLTMWIGSAAARGRKWNLRIASTVLILVVLVIILAGLLYLTVIPMALQSKVEPLVMTGIKKSIFKSLVQAVVYPLVLAYVAVKAWRHTVAPQSVAP